MSSSLADLLASGISLFSQEARLIQLRFPDGSGIDRDGLLPHRLSGEEKLSHSYRYELDCLSADMHLELKDLLGQPVEIALRLPEGGQRLLTGLVTRAEQRGADGGLARYRLIIEPALATLAHRHNSRVYQDRSVPEIVAALLDEHRANNPVLAQSFHYQTRLDHSYPPRSYCLQYRESDLAFIERLLAEEGISYAYTHGSDGETSRSEGPFAGRSPPLHTLVLFDANHQLPADTRRRIRFHRTEGVEADDAIDQWHGSRQIQTGETLLASYDYRAVNTHTGAESTRAQHGDAGHSLVDTLEDYDPQTGYYGSTPDEMARYAALRQQGRDLASKSFRGEGSVRSLYPGASFHLLAHPIHDQDTPENRDFLVTGVSFTAENNLTPEAQSSLGSLLGPVDPAGAPTGVGQGRPPYRNTFTAVRRHVPVVPDFSRSRHQKPTAHGVTTATVVGPAGEEIFTDPHGRIKIQFHWQRPGDHPLGGAALDDRSSTWVRIAMPSAGAGWGSQYIPRVGQEVVVDFIENDIDRPLVTGVVYNGSHPPPAFSGAGSLPANKTLSGHKSKEYKGERYNELLFDDSTGELRAKLSSEHGKTQLNQGYLIHPRSEGKGEARGEGFELRTDQHGAIRAAQGLLLTTEAQTAATGKQLARDQAQSQLEAALSLARNLGEVAARQSADTVEHGPEKIDPDNGRGEKSDSGHLQHHVDALRAWESGSNTDKAGKTGPGEKGRRPLLVLSAPTGIASITGQNQTLAAGSNLDLVAQRDTNQTTGRRWLHNVGQHISLFVNGVKDKIALKLIAAQGKVQMLAQQGDIEITADRDVTVTACKGKVVITAKDEILLTSGGSYIRLKDGNIEIHCPGLVSSKGAKHEVNGPASMNVAHPAFPQNLPTLPLILNLDQAPLGAGSGWNGMPYMLYADGALVDEGVLDSAAPLAVEHEVTTRKYKLELANGVIYDIPVPLDYSNPAEGETANLGFQKIAAAPKSGGMTTPASLRADYFQLLKNPGQKGDQA